MFIAQYDKSMVKYFVDPSTSLKVNAQPDLQAPAGTIPIVMTEEEFKVRFKNVPYQIIGEKMEPNNTRTIEDSFGFKVDDNMLVRESQKNFDSTIIQNEMNKVKFQESIGLTNQPIYSPQLTQLSYKEIDLQSLFKRAVADSFKAKGAKDVISKKSYCNGVGAAIVTVYPHLKDRLKEIVEDVKNSGTSNEVDSFI